MTTLWLRIIAAVTIGVLSGAAGFVSRYWIEALLRGKFGTYVSVINGTWDGKFTQRRGVIGETNINLALNSKLNIVYGEITYGDNKLKCVGGFVQDRYLSLHYKNEVESKLQHGNIILLLGGNNESLTGDFIGVGPSSEKIVIGTIELTKGP